MPEQRNVVAEESYAALVAIDWADQKHVWSLHAAGSRKRESGELQHSPEAVESWVGQLCQRFGEQAIAVAVEQRRGALVFMLSKYERLHIFPVPPTMSSNMRKALYPSGAKDDPKDADLLLDILEKHGNKLRRLQPDTEQTRRIQNLVEERRKLVDEKTAQSNRLIANLKIYFPQVPKWFKDVDSDLVCDLLQRWPTLEKLQRAQTTKLYDFLHRHRFGNEERILGLMKEIRQAKEAINDQAVQEAKVAVVKVSMGMLTVLREGIKELDHKIQEAAAAHPDFFIFKSLPGAGPVLAPRLIAAFGSRRERFQRAEELQVYSGISPVISSSGRNQWVHFRFACPKFLRQTFHEWAGHSIVFSIWARAYYDLQRSKGKGHHAAVRALAFKWLRIAFRCWKDHVPYQEASYLEALKKRNAPLLASVLA